MTIVYTKSVLCAFLVTTCRSDPTRQPAEKKVFEFRPLPFTLPLEDCLWFSSCSDICFCKI